jgi:hypothetical protein
MDFVWPYIKYDSAWEKLGLFNELEYSIKSVRKFYRGNVRCFVVGDDPGLDVIHIPVERFKEEHKQPRHMDFMKKLDAILDSAINEEYILIYDDVFLLKPVTRADFKITYGITEVTDPEEYIKTRTGTSPYKRIWLSTYDYLYFDQLTKGRKLYDWETHLPRLREKTKVKDIIDSYALKQVPRLPEGLYEGRYSEETVIMEDDLQSNIWTHKPGMDFGKEFSKKFMNISDNVIVPEFVELMEKHMA